MAAVQTIERHAERELFQRYHSDGDVVARDRLICQGIPLARKLAMRYTRRGEPDDDLLQVASIGLIKAVDRFDPSRGTAFSSFAVPSILGELKRHFRHHGWATHVARPLQERVLKMQAATERLSADLRRGPTPRELAKATGESVEDVLEALEAATAHDSVSLDAPLGSATDDGGRATYADTVGAEDPRLELVDYRSVVDRALHALPEREQLVLSLRFDEDMTQSEIAARIGISQMHVSRLIRRALDRLRKVADSAEA
jgi:RNA polymerase sigma-B factor